MKTDLASQAHLALVASIAAVAIMIATPSRVLAADAVQTAQASQPSAGAAPAGVSHPPSNGVEVRVKHLHDQLKITPEQEAQWRGVAQVMLDNASAVDDAIKNRVRKAGSMNAIDDLRSYQAIVDDHAAGLKKLADAFAPLYSAMPEVQQKNADAVFGHRTGPAKLKTHG